MARLDMDSYVDWTGCDLVERVAGTRILADTIVEDAEMGSPVEEIQENYPDLTRATIERLLAFAQNRRRRRAS
jgi:uncharacterized protein (DUF433 family)